MPGYYGRKNRLEWRWTTCRSTALERAFSDRKSYAECCRFIPYKLCVCIFAGAVFQNSYLFMAPWFTQLYKYKSFTMLNKMATGVQLG